LYDATDRFLIHQGNTVSRHLQSGETYYENLSTDETITTTTTRESRRSFRVLPSSMAQNNAFLEEKKRAYDLMNMTHYMDEQRSKEGGPKKTKPYDGKTCIEYLGGSMVVLPTDKNNEGTSTTKAKKKGDFSSTKGTGFVYQDKIYPFRNPINAPTTQKDVTRQLTVESMSVSIDTTFQSSKRVDSKIMSRKSVSNLWLRGTKIPGKTISIFDPPKEEEESNLRVDVLSIGSTTKTDLLEAQAAAFSLHPSIRYHFGITELDDGDPTCSQRLTKEKMVEISQFCHGRKTARQRWKHSDLMKYQTNQYAHGYYLDTKSPGWMCAQKRPSHGIGQVGEFYRKGLELYNEHLPDYLLIVDDDTYINPFWFQSRFGKYNPSVPRAEAGCLVFSQFNNSFPFGGFGTILNKGALSKLIQPVYCSNSTNTFSSHVCHQLDQNLIGEEESFKEGMSVSDLMNAHASRENYADFPNWTSTFPYCLHSDWATGFYINYYGIPNHVSEFSNETSSYINRPMYRIGWKLGSISKHVKGICKKDEATKCKSSSRICHRLSAENMTNVANLLASSNNTSI
jgi:hypothetical protein